MSSPGQGGQPRNVLRRRSPQSWRSHLIASVQAVRAYAGAWSSGRGEFFGCVYTSDDDGRPMKCCAPVRVSGWSRDGAAGWHAVDACAEHASQPEQPARVARELAVSPLTKPE